METPAGSRQGVLRLFLLFALAAAYFSAGATLPLEWSDEGQIVYPSWRVAEGAIPYRDFGHLYGPSLFFLNGALLRVFGADLLVLRVSLVFLKAVTAVLVYVCTARVAAAPLPMLAYALLVVVWGGPWWVFNTPYANHYAATCILAGLVVFLRLRSVPFRAPFLAGICFGIAATFKQTTGAFATAALALFLLRDSLRCGAEADGESSTKLPVWAVRLARIAVLGGIAALAVAYLAPQSTWANTLVLASPATVLLGALLAAELRSSIGAGSLRALGAIGACGLGTFLPLAGYAALYGAWGLLPELSFNLAGGLPQIVDWFTPYPMPTAGALALAMAFGGLVGASASRRRGGSQRRLCVPVGAFFVLPAVTLFVADVIGAGGLSSYIGKTAFYGPVLRFFLLLPLLVVWAGLPGFVRGLRNGPGRPADLFLCLAVIGLLFLYPAADFWHALMALPLFLPALAHALRRAPGGHVEEGGGAATAWPLAACFFVLAAPFVHGLWTARAAEPVTDRSFVRARGIAGHEPHFVEVLDLVEEIDARTAAERPLLVLTDEQMIYFLLARPSALEREEFALYLVGAGLIREPDARILIPEERMIERLRDARPVIVDREGNPAVKRFRRTFPRVAAHIASHCPRVAQRGGYDILDCAAGPSS